MAWFKRTGLSELRAKVAKEREAELFERKVRAERDKEAREEAKLKAYLHERKYGRVKRAGRKVGGVLAKAGRRIAKSSRKRRSAGGFGRGGSNPFGSGAGNPFA